jgi:YbgC/YbaW family acyl-CoA thioester hydrolase
MARIQLTFPEPFIYATTLYVRASDLNYGAHVGNDAVLTLMQEARVMLYRRLGFPDEMTFEGTIGQIIADAAVQYKSEAFLGDELVIKISVNEFTKYGFDMYYLIENISSGKVAAIGKTGIVCFDYDKRKVSPVPAVLLERLQSLR